MLRSTLPVIVSALFPLAGWCQPAATPGQPAQTQPTEPPQPATDQLDWRALESPVLSNQVQLTFPDLFLKAGEAYFDPTGRWIIFQATPRPKEGFEPLKWYRMYLAKLRFDDKGGVVGTEEPTLVSPPMAASTCGFFSPIIKGRILFGTTVKTPAEPKKDQDFKVRDRYVWQFPEEMDIVLRFIPELWSDQTGRPINDRTRQTFPPEANQLVRLFERPGYDAEASWSPDGRHVIYTQTRDSEGKPDADIYIYDTFQKKSHPVIVADGYDGGPFFSPDGTMICYRSDRKQDDLLQIYTAKLKFNEGGFFEEVESEHQLTDNGFVNWAPFWHPSSRFLIYGTSEMGHTNYELFAIEVNPSKSAAELKRVRITHANGADVLPTFNSDGTRLMWTAQRGPKRDDEQKPSSQLWIADFNADAVKFE